MKLGVTILGIIFLFSSCIPYKIAPQIEEYKVVRAKKFYKRLPRDYGFVFEDPKNANEFYSYVNVKYERNHKDVDRNVPFIIDGEEVFFSFHEIERTTETINLAPIFADVILEEKEFPPIFENVYYFRKGNWYVVLTVLDEKC